jgi:hypothetical protein
LNSVSDSLLKEKLKSLKIERMIWIMKY